MNNTVCFRDFEERDIDFIYKCKNDGKLNSMIVGQFKSFTYEDAQKWVHGCMGHHDEFIFWVIATNDEDRRIVGWAALSKIDKVNKSANTHSIVIADPEYNDGTAWIESILFMLEYAFERLNLHRVYGHSLVGHKISNMVEPLMFMQNEGILRDAVYKNGRYYDISCAAILRDEYFAHKEAGDYDMMKIIRRLRKIRKGSK